MPGKRGTLQQRLEAKILKLESCWEWQGYVNPDGYGRIHGGDRRWLLAHRATWEVFNGPIPPAMTLDHLCKNRKCVNPSHLEIVTLAENVMRGNGPAAINARKLFCNKNHPLVGENLYVGPDKARRCRACDREKWRKRYWAKKDGGPFV